MTDDDPLHWHSGPDTTWTTVNTAEALPGVLTPLAWTWWADGVELGMRECFYDLGVLRKDEIVAHEHADDRYSVVFFGRYTANITAMRRIGDLMPGTDGDAVEEQILGGLHSGIPPANTRRRYLVVALKMPRLAVGIPKTLARVRRETLAWWVQNTSPGALADAAGAPARFADARRRFQEIMRPHAAATMLCQAAYEQVRLVAVAAGLPGLETSLVTGYGDFEEAQIAIDLWEVSRGGMTLERFVADHGYHGPNEGTLHSKSWREDDTPLRKLVETYRTMPDDADPHSIGQERTAQRRRAEATLLAATPRRRRLRARAVLALAHRQIPLREIGKAAFLQAVDVARAAARTRGAELAARGAIDDPDDVYYLTADELEAGTTADLKPRIASRRAKREGYQRVRLPDTWTGAPEPIALEGDGDGARLEELSGLPVAPGVVEARARVVTDPDTGIDIEPGEVLVCNTTDPSWASYFLVASALVIDIGGAMSHGAIVARELGVPCVINTRVGTKAIRTGDLLRVDGGAGEVRVLERAEGQAPPEPPAEASAGTVP